MKSFGQIAYDAYCDCRGWLSFKGEALPPWDQQQESLRLAWEAAALAVLLECDKDKDRETPRGDDSRIPTSVRMGH
jgi:hypothetical protein